MKLQMLAPWKESYDYLNSIFKKQRHHFANKGLYSQSCIFSSSCVWMWQLDHKEGWVSNNRCFWIVVLEQTLESPLNCKDIKPVNSKGNQPWIFIGRTHAEAEPPILWLPNTKIWKESFYWKISWSWERLRAKGEAGDRGWDGWMAHVHGWLKGHEFEQILGDCEGRGSLTCLSPRGQQRAAHNLVAKQQQTIYSY